MFDIYLRELEEYSFSYLSNKLGFSEDKTLRILNKLKDYEFVRFDIRNNYYQFYFVGLIIVEDVVIKCYPKYIKNNDSPFSEFNQIIKVLKKFNKINEIDYENDLLEDVSFNLLSLMIFFIEDYYEHGIYTSFREIYEINGMGEINWDKSINNKFPLIKDDKPYYIELYTKKKLTDNFNYFKILHEFIVTECCKKLKEFGLLNVFDFTEVLISDKSLDDFGDSDIIINKIEKELSMEFNSHKQKLLKYMRSFLLEENSLTNNNFFTLYGTNNYKKIWENICSEVIGNELYTKLKDLKLPGPLHEKYGSSDIILKKIIDHPNWVFYGINEFEKETLEPDLITFNLEENEFLILDAKYYDLDVNLSKLKGQPGVADITKQYLYQLAYMEFINLHCFDKVKNAFLFPTEGNFENKGYVEIDMLNNIRFSGDLNHLETIQIVMLSASKMNELYLKDGKLKLKYLNLI